MSSARRRRENMDSPKKIVKIAKTKLGSRLAGDGRGVAAFIISASTRACNTASDPGVNSAKNLGGDPQSLG